MADTVQTIYKAAPGFRMIPKSEYVKFEQWKLDQQKIKTWRLRDLAKYKFGTKSTERASRYLIKHRDDLDIERGGFIDYVNTHNGWRIPAGEMMDYLLNHPD